MVCVRNELFQNFIPTKEISTLINQIFSSEQGVTSSDVTLDGTTNCTQSTWKEIAF